MINKKKLVLWSGILIGGIHLIRATCVALMPMQLQSFIDWIMGLHFVKPYIVVTQFDLTSMMVLVGFTFVVGCLLGRIIGLIINSIIEKNDTMEINK